MENTGAPALLSSRLERVTTLLTRRTAHVHQAQGGLSSPECYILLVLGAMPAECSGMTSTSIVEVTAMDKTKVSRAVASLDHRGWIKRTRADFDRRFEYLALTEAGRTAFDSLEPEVRAAESKVLKELSSEERACLCAALAALERVLGR